MSAIRQALIRAHRECPDFPVERPEPSTAFWCLEVRANANCTICGHPISVGSRAKRFLCTDCRAYLQKRRAAGWST